MPDGRGPTYFARRTPVAPAKRHTHKPIIPVEVDWVPWWVRHDLEFGPEGCVDITCQRCHEEAWR